jgi:cytochrome c biogenesis protein CcmG/thiol:disulfide interchange protein DsbE
MGLLPINIKCGIVFAVITLILLAGVNAGAQQAPSFALMNSNGVMVYKKDLKGNLVISFFASYCRPCRKELPALVDLVKKYEKGKHLSLVLITADINDQSGEALDKARDFLKDIGIRQDFLLDVYHVVISKYSPKKIVPATFLVDRRGYVVFREIGSREDTVSRLEKHIQSLK